jgi:hypothetical protein
MSTSFIWKFFLYDKCLTKYKDKIRLISNCVKCDICNEILFNKLINRQESKDRCVLQSFSKMQ